MSTSPVVGRTSVSGITVSTVLIADRNYYETAVFDDRNGKRYGNRSRVVETYADDRAARNGHRHWSGMSQAELLTHVTPTR